VIEEEEAGGDEAELGELGRGDPAGRRREEARVVGGSKWGTTSRGRARR
jgi:hypothetical protein